MLTEREFDEVRRKIVMAWHKGDVDVAFAAIEKVFEREGTPDMKGECLFYRGMIRESGGDLPAARRDWIEALQYAREGTFLRFQLEHNIGESLEREGLPEEALGWYKIALKTCSKGDEYSGHQALNAYLKLKGGKIEPGDEPLIASVIVSSWRVLELPGTPDLKDLSSTATELANVFSNRVEIIVRDS
jgi:tetratricopeptide (TPR) repeat protein